MGKTIIFPAARFPPESKTKLIGSDYSILSIPSPTSAAKWWGMGSMDWTPFDTFFAFSFFIFDIF